MNLEKSNRLFILAIAAGLLLLGTTVFLQGQMLGKMQRAVTSISESLNSQIVSAPSTEVDKIPSNAQSSESVAQPTYVSCRREYLGPSANSGDGRLLCVDGAGKETVFLQSIGNKFGIDMSDSFADVDLIRFVPNGQMAYFRFRPIEADVVEYGLSYLNLRTGATGRLLDMIPSDEYVPETSVHFSDDSKFLVVGSGVSVDVENASNYVDIQALYVFDLRTATLVNKISPERANTTFLSETDCRAFHDISVSWTDEKMSYRFFNKPIQVTAADGFCEHESKGGLTRTVELPK